MKKKAIFVLIIVFFVIFIGTKEKFQFNTPKTLQIGQTVLNIEVANTQAEREKGLSGKTELGEDEGLLFIFEREGYYGFWMKDMNFPIDIAWFDENKMITHIEKDVLPETYPKIFNSSVPSFYVLEVGANFFEDHGIKIGDVAKF